MLCYIRSSILSQLMYIDCHSKLSCYVRTYVLHPSLSLQLIFLCLSINLKIRIIVSQAYHVSGVRGIFYGIQYLMNQRERAVCICPCMENIYSTLWTYGTFLGFFSFSIKLFGWLQKRGRWLACCPSRAKDVSLDLFRQGHVSNDTNPL